MQIVQLIWALNFFVFAFILFFTWSKIYVISRKFKSISTVLKKNEDLAKRLDTEG